MIKKAKIIKRVNKTFTNSGCRFNVTNYREVVKRSCPEAIGLVEKCNVDCRTCWKLARKPLGGTK